MGFQLFSCFSCTIDWKGERFVPYKG